MKKTFCVLSTFFIIYSLSACSADEVIEELTAEGVKSLLNDIDISEIAIDDFDIPLEINELVLTWTSNHENLVIVDDEVIVNRDDKDEEVFLTVSTTFEEETYSKTFEVFVPNNLFDNLGDPSDHSDEHKFVLDYLEYKYDNEYNYIKETTGSTEGNVTIIFPVSVKQDVNAVSYKYEDKILYDIKSETAKSPTGYDINVYQKGVFKEDQIIISHARESITNSTPLKRPTDETYALDYGVSQLDESFTGYTISNESISSSSYEKIGENYKFSYELTPGSCSVNKQQQITVFGKLEEVNIKSINLEIIIDENYNIIEYNSVEVFDAKMEGFKSTLSQSTKTTFKSFSPIDTPYDSLGFDKFINALI